MIKKTAKKFLYDLLDIYEKYNIDYAIIAGAFLGAVRDNDFIKWDNDLDMVVFKPFWFEYEKMRKIVGEMNKRGIIISNCWNMISLTFKKNSIWCNTSYLKRGEKYWYKYNNQGRNTFPLACFDKLEKRMFQGRKMIFPSNPDLYFQHVYGKDWKTPKNTKQHFHHDSSFRHHGRMITRAVFTYDR